MREMIMKFLKDEEGASMVEYALLLALIAVVCIAAVTNIGTSANSVFEGIATKLGYTAPATP